MGCPVPFARGRETTSLNLVLYRAGRPAGLVGHGWEHGARMQRKMWSPPQEGGVFAGKCRNNCVVLTVGAGGGTKSARSMRDEIKLNIGGR